ncbi:MAG: hypothetical protein ACR2MO_09250 [Acidimicrobiales bacterium]
MLLLLLLSAVVTGAGLYRQEFRGTDLVALAVMMAATAWLMKETFVTLRRVPERVAATAGAHVDTPLVPAA